MFYQDVMLKVNDIQNKSDQETNTFLSDYFTIDELKTVVKKLKNSKAGRYDSLVYEHIKYGGDMFVRPYYCAV